MKQSKLIVLFVISIAFAGCDSKTSNSVPAANKLAASASQAAPSPSVPANGDYPGKGKVTKINMEAGSVELDHEEIKGVMAPMLMEFFVSDKKLLNGLAVGDDTDFVLRYKDPTEIIVDIKKVK